MKSFLKLIGVVVIIAVFGFSIFSPQFKTVVSSIFDRQPKVTEEQVKAHYVKMAHAVYSDALSTAQTLQQRIDEFLAAPSAEGLDAAKAAYKATRIPYQQSEIMRWDTDITSNTMLDIDGGPASVDTWEVQVNAWPLDESLIDYVEGGNQVNIISGAEPITKEYLITQNGINDNEANVATGIHAIEFLLWGQDLNGSQAGAGKRSYTDYLLGEECSHQHCERRRTYLKTVTDLLVDDLTDMQQEWSEEATQNSGSLAYNFLKNEKSVAYILAAMKKMATDELASARIATALENNDTEEEHDCFSDLSHVANYYNFQGVKNAFYGTYGSLSGPSLADLVKQASGSQFKSFDQHLKSIDVKLKQLLDAGERTQNTVRFDQLVAQQSGTQERKVAEDAVQELVGLAVSQGPFDNIQTLLSLQTVATDGAGDGD